MMTFVLDPNKRIQTDQSPEAIAERIKVITKKVFNREHPLYAHIRCYELWYRKEMEAWVEHNDIRTLVKMIKSKADAFTPEELEKVRIINGTNYKELIDKEV